MCISLSLYIYIYYIGMYIYSHIYTYIYIYIATLVSARGLLCLYMAIDISISIISGVINIIVIITSIDQCTIIVIISNASLLL